MKHNSCVHKYVNQKKRLFKSPDDFGINVTTAECFHIPPVRYSDEPSCLQKKVELPTNVKIKLISSFSWLRSFAFSASSLILQRSAEHSERSLAGHQHQQNPGTPNRVWECALHTSRFPRQILGAAVWLLHVFCVNTPSALKAQCVK